MTVAEQRIYSSLRVTAVAGGVLLRPEGSYSERLKTVVYRELPSAVWDRKERAWAMPDTAGAAVRLIQAVPALAQIGVELRTAGWLRLEAGSYLTRPAPRYDDVPLSGSRPRRHQAMAHWYLAWAREALGAALLDCGMRTGKTLMVLNHLREQPAGRRGGLVVAPAVVVPVWAEQCAEHCSGDLAVVPLDGGSVAERVRRALAEIGRDRVAVVGWSVLERLDVEQKRALRAALAGKTVVADEVHYGKAPGSERSRSLHYVSTRAAMRIGASGTPLSHSPLDAYAVFRFLDSGIWGTSYSRFRDAHAVMGGYGGHQVLGYRNLDELARRMAPYTLTVTRDVLDLPPAQHIDVTVELPAAAMATYLLLRDEAVAELRSGTLVAANALAKLTRLAQLTSGSLPAQDGSGRLEQLHDAKGSALRELLESCDPSEPWVVFGRFHQDLDTARRAAEAAGRPAFELSGRVKQLPEWRSAAGCRRGPVLCAQIASGGIGIDLAEAAFCAYLSCGFSLAEWEQSLARVHGPTQTRPVAYYHVVARGTVDAHIRRALGKRAEVLEFVSLALREAQS